MLGWGGGHGVHVQIISPDDVKAVVGKGMPLRGNPFVKGDLFVKFEVAFPKSKTLSAASLAVRCSSGRFYLYYFVAVVLTGAF